MESTLIGGVAVVPLIMGLVEIAKRAFGLPGTYAALLSAGLGTTISLGAWAVAVVPLIMGLVEIAKRAFGLPGTYAALLSAGLGTAISLGAWAAHTHGAAADPFQATIGGLALGLSASGLYSVAHAVTTRKEPPPHG